MIAPEAGRTLLPSLEAELDEGAEIEAEKQRQKSKELFISQVVIIFFIIYIWG